MFWFALISSILALGLAIYLAYFVLTQEEGNEKMKEISRAIREGANAYLKRQYIVISIFFAIMFFIMLLLSYYKLMSFTTPFLFLLGGFFSALTGFIGMNIATRANVRTTNAATKSLNKALRVAFSSGAVMGLSVVGLALFAITLSFAYLTSVFNNLGDAVSALLAFSMGASSVALFARVGGGIFTKAADVGADLVGKVESGIPEDDPRNPAVIADNVGDNVGDVAGMGADLYESYVGSIIAAMILGFVALKSIDAVLLPLAIAGCGIVASIIGTFFVRSGEKTEQHILLLALRKGIIAAALVVAFLSFIIFKIQIFIPFKLFYSMLVGLVAGVLIGLVTEYYTSSKYKHVRELAKSSLTGAATTIIDGLAVGMLSTFIPVLIVSVSTIASYYLAGGSSDFNLGLYGISLAAVGMLSTLGITLATDAYGPVADNAGGIAEMSHQKPIVRKRTDALDALGNTTAATGKGFAIGSAALTALALIATLKTFVPQLNLSLLTPSLIAGLMIGAMLPFLFSSMALKAVGRAASQIVEEVRKQFKELKLLTTNNKPNYARCVSISTRAAQKEMILPSLIAIIAPILVGVLFGVEAVFGLLAGALSSGFVLAILMSNAGGAWDNAKKYIEEGHYGGKGSDTHKAAVVGDTVGDPFKDTAGPSLNILIKLMSIVALVFLPFIIKFALIG
ncbi:MAG: sodium-translocating pyrophosphatase [Candidatus Woesearchaeota archaeon]